MTQDELIKLIDEAAADGRTTLDLSGQGLSELPPEIGKLTNLKTLILGRFDYKGRGKKGNNLTALPDNVGKLTELRTLFLDYNQFKELPEIVGSLRKLRSLNARSNQISELSEGVGQLTNLRLLTLGDNRISELPEGIGQLTNLRSLNLIGNQINELPKGIGQLVNLRSLVLSNNRISEVPEGIGQLINLQSLNLRDNRLSDLPEGVGQLANLQSLDLCANQLNNIPTSLYRASNIQYLAVGGNFITEVSDEISNFSNLKKLSLGSAFLLRNTFYFNCFEFLGITRQGNRLSCISDCLLNISSLEELDLSFNQLSNINLNIRDANHIKKLDLRGNPLPIPPEILGSSRFMSEPNDIKKILSFYFQLQSEEGSVPLYEAKLILVGEGGAGKTSLARKIDSEDYELKEDEKSTEGIDVIRWDFPFGEQDSFRVNIWDFGGQEIYHATHQFFLTKRSLYLLVADNRKENTDFYYWLKVVELLSDSSPVLVIKNEKQGRQCQIDEGLYKRQFNSLKDYLPTDLKENRGIDKIKEAIRYHIAQLPHVGNPLPKIWVRVRAALENYSKNYNTITVEQYFNICRQNGFTDHEQMLFLSSYLHDLGVCLHFQDDKLLKRTVILRPEWATTAVYKVADNKKVYENKGRFTEADTKEIWSDKQYSSLRDELLQLMMRFKLAYELPNQPGHYIAPQLLPLSEPKYDWDDNENLVLRYEYEFMPKGIVTRFIVEINKLIEDNTVWKNGVVLVDPYARARVVENYPKREISVRVSGGNKKPLLEKIRYEFWKIHESYEKLEYEELIPCNCGCQNSQKPQFYPYELLTQYISDHRYNIECRTSYKQVDVRRLMSDIKDESVRRDIIGRDFIYSDEQFENHFRQHSVHIDKSTHITNNSPTNQYGQRDNYAGDSVSGDKIHNQTNSAVDIESLSRTIDELIEEISDDYKLEKPGVEKKIQRDAMERVEEDTDLRQRIKNAFKAGCAEALEQTVQNPFAKVFIKTCQGFLSKD